MAFPSNYYLLLLLFLFLVYPSSIEAASSKTSFKPKALSMPIIKDASTNQYITLIFQRNPQVVLILIFDLGGKYLWVDCDKGYVSSSYRSARCGSAECLLAESNTCIRECYSSRPRPGCNDNTCAVLASNTITNTSAAGQLGVDLIVVISNDGSNLTPFVSVPKFIFACVSTFLLEGLASNSQGMAGLGRSPISFPSQYFSAFSIDRKFAICLTTSTDLFTPGIVFFGDSPYVFMPDNIDFSKSLNYTPLIRNPVLSSEYFIGVKSIKINGKTVPLNKKLLTIDKNGHGGTKISTVDPYTVMETSLYNAFLNVFDKELAREVPRVEAVAPFGACFNATYVAITEVGRSVPQIDLVLQNDVIWRILGANSMVRVRVNVICLGFVDGGINPITSIVIGGYQLEDNLIQFDLENNKLGFSDSLLLRRTSCESFNYTSIP